VIQRRKEIGIRMAVGADGRRVVWDVVRKGLGVTLAGVAIGVVLALLGVQLIERLLFGVRAEDPLILAAAASALVLVAVVASVVPAINAVRVDPVTVLRTD
jgi:ABC-type antimicrobial peptide transport system permease subunit